MTANEKLTNNSKVHYFHFSHHRLNQTFRHLRKFAKQNRKQTTSILAPRKDFSAVSADASEVIAASLDLQFHDSADFSDLRAARLDSTGVYCRYEQCVMTP